MHWVCTDGYFYSEKYQWKILVVLLLLIRIELVYTHQVSPETRQYLSDAHSHQSNQPSSHYSKPDQSQSKTLGWILRLRIADPAKLCTK